LRLNRHEYVGPPCSISSDDPTSHAFNSLSVKWDAIEYAEWLIGLPYPLDPAPLLPIPRVSRRRQWSVQATVVFSFADASLAAKIG
jgi:hypothetical protein